MKAILLFLLMFFSLILFVKSQSTGTFIDERDNQSYQWVKIGTQVWMAENLNYNIGKCWCYKNDPTNCIKYGRLYDWNTIMKGNTNYLYSIKDEKIQGICPDGWYIPRDSDWKILVGTVDSFYGPGHKEWDEYLNVGYDVGKRLKSKDGWLSEGNGIDSYGFSAEPAGFRNDHRWNFEGLGAKAFFWTSTVWSSNDPISWEISYLRDEIIRKISVIKKEGFSLRCIKGHTYY